MLDLNILEESYFPMKLLNGEVINIKKPTQKMIITFATMDKKIMADKKKQDVGGIMTTNIDRLTIILNHNKEEYKVTKEMIEEFTPTTMQIIVTKYIEWVQDITNAPN